jgi:hypothetical protein
VDFLIGGLTGLAVWYGFDTSGFLGGVASLMSSVMKFAAFVGLLAGGEDDSLWPHACLSGDGMAGVVGLAGNAVVRRRGAETPFG